MFNDAIFARRVHTLKNKQDCPLILRVKLVLQVGKLFQTLLQGRSRVLLRPNARGIGRIEVSQLEMLATLYAVRLRQFP